jgi:hypothetical protein
VSVLPDPEVQAHWARYLCILVSGFVESSVREVYRQYARNKAAPNVANFVEGRLKGFQNPKMEKILELTRLFSPEWEATLRLAVEGEPKDAVDSIVANRNRIAHGEDVSVSYANIRAYYMSSTKVIQLIEDQCQS